MVKNQDRIKRIQELVLLLNKANVEYNKLYNELQQLEVTTGFMLPNSPTKNNKNYGGTYEN